MHILRLRPCRRPPYQIIAKLEAYLLYVSLWGFISEAWRVLGWSFEVSGNHLGPRTDFLKL